MTEIASLVLFATDPEATAAFYRVLGLPLEHEDHGDGPVHFATELGDVHFAVYPSESAGEAPPLRAGGSSFPGFYVTSLDETVAELAGLGSRVVTRHEVRPWGCRAVVEDPDGRPVEVNQRSHCPRG